MLKKSQNIIASFHKTEGRVITFGLTLLESEETSYNILMSSVQRHNPRLSSIFIEKSELVEIKS